MSKTKADITGSAAQRILEVASELFFQNGYRATGINEVIAKAGVAKATFYSHFPSKEALAQAYIENAARAELRYLDECIARGRNPLERFLSVMISLQDWLKETDYRGCPFINLASEAPDPNSPLREAGKWVYAEARQRVARVSRELVASDATKYGHVDSEGLTRDYMLLFAGAVSLAGLYHAMWPVEEALEGVHALIG